MYWGCIVLCVCVAAWWCWRWGLSARTSGWRTRSSPAAASKRASVLRQYYSTRTSTMPGWVYIRNIYTTMSVGLCIFSDSIPLIDMYNVWLQSTTLKSLSIFFTSIFFIQSIYSLLCAVYICHRLYIHTIDSISTRESQGIIHTRERSHFLFLTVGSMKGKCVIPGSFTLIYQSNTVCETFIQIYYSYYRLEVGWGLGFGVWGELVYFQSQMCISIGTVI